MPLSVRCECPALHPPTPLVWIESIPAHMGFLHLSLEDWSTPACRAPLWNSDSSDHWLGDLIQQVGRETIASWPCPFIHLRQVNIPLHTLSMPLRMDRLDRDPMNAGTVGLNSQGRCGYFPASPPAGDPVPHVYRLFVFVSPLPQTPPADFSTRILPQLEWETWVEQIPQVERACASFSMMAPRVE